MGAERTWSAYLGPKVGTVTPAPVAAVNPATSAPSSFGPVSTFGQSMPKIGDTPYYMGVSLAGTGSGAQAPATGVTAASTLPGAPVPSKITGGYSGAAEAAGVRLIQPGQLGNDTQSPMLSNVGFDGRANPVSAQGAAPVNTGPSAMDNMLREQHYFDVQKAENALKYGAVDVPGGGSIRLSPALTQHYQNVLGMGTTGQTATNIAGIQAQAHETAAQIAANGGIRQTELNTGTQMSMQNYQVESSRVAALAAQDTPQGQIAKQQLSDLRQLAGTSVTDPSYAKLSAAYRAKYWAASPVYGIGAQDALSVAGSTGLVANPNRTAGT